MGSKRNIPPLRKLPYIHLDVRALATRAETDETLLVYDTTLDDGVMVSDGQRVIIITGTHGYLIISKDKIPELVEELINVHEDMCRNIWCRI